jgi:outer membrane lipopolysaccharide assembly protein LptE/RlpB
MARRIIPFLVVAIVVILTGCGSPVEAFDLVIESPEGSREVELRDILRRSPEEEALVSATMEEAPSLSCRWVV